MNHNMSFSTHLLFKSLRRRPICTSSIVALHRSLTLQSKRRSRSRRNITRRSQTTDGNWHFLSSNDTLSPEACMTQGGCVTCTQTSPDCWRLSSKYLASRPRRLFVRAPFLNVPIWIILKSLWVQCRFRKAGLSSFSGKDFLLNIQCISTPTRPNLTKIFALPFSLAHTAVSTKTPCNDFIS